MTPSTLRAAGEALYGPRWQCELAREIDVADRTVRRWLDGTHAIPPGVALDLVQLLHERQHAIDDVLLTLASSATDAEMVDGQQR